MKQTPLSGKLTNPLSFLQLLFPPRISVHRLKFFQRLLRPKPPKPNPPLRRLPPKLNFFLGTSLRFETAGFLCDVLLPKPPPAVLRLAERNLVLLILFRDFFEVERNLFEDTLFPPDVFAEEDEGVAFFIFEVDAPLRF